MSVGADRISCSRSLTNAKPSSIFRLRNTFIPSAPSFSSTTFGSPAASTSSTATLGILCEPLESVEAQLAALGQSAAAVAANPATSTAVVRAGSSTAPDPVRLAQLVGKNLFNAVAGFAQPLPGGQAGQWLPFEAIERWYRCVAPCRAPAARALELLELTLLP